ncbi:gluconolactonase [Ktedonosporobacter rubrisoli]|uniref:Gluconolactonase n=1 Tax=Ktedonosporobacter rubrisoli TaxID=2509675 RepID=A0A4P6JMT6_KTERU|nr:gluconolactonase [Ktedonosporobacter rubrisoli]QBD76006.1 gluconolactonase [Ktedonosporobacter rubrisoli]
MTHTIPGAPTGKNFSRHDRGELLLVPAKTLASFPSGTFLENLAISANGDIFMTSFRDGAIIRHTSAGTQEVVARLDGTVSGIVTAPNDGLFVCSRQPQGPESIFHIDIHGRVEKWLNLPGARFLNGMTRLSEQVLLAADSFTATIWQVDLVQRQVSPWLTHRLLSKRSSQNSLPGPNGIKVFAGAVFVSNSERASVIRIPVLEQQQAGEPAIYASHFLLDDFTFDEQGNLYGATHPLNTVERLARNGTRLTIAEPEQGVSGCTAVAFDAGEGAQHLLYVVTDGGTLAGKPEPARLVCLDTGGLPR